MDQKVERLFQEKNLIFIATINLDGSPQLTPVWGDYQDGHILINVNLIKNFLILCLLEKRLSRDLLLQQ